MNKKDAYKVLKVRRKPFYTWILRILWVVWLLFWLEVALGSRLELEPRAARISLVILGVSFFLGMIFWVIGVQKTRRRS